MVSEDGAMKSLSADYSNLLANGQAFSDVTFSVEGREVYAHRCILAARSSFFRMIFCTRPEEPPAGGGNSGPQRVIPVGAVGYDVFYIVLHFLYSGQLLTTMANSHQAALRYKCKERACWHQHCSSAVDLALDTLNAANFFGVDQLSYLVQRQLSGMVDKASIDDVMRVLVTARKQELPHLWATCSDLVAKSGLTAAALKKHLPVEMVQEMESMRLQRGYGSHCSRISGGAEHISGGEEQRIRRMRQALDSLDVELVRLMVMGEGLNLDKAHALHYSVANCSREVVKALLELGAVDVNYPSEGGQTALHLAAQMVNPDMISVLLDHHADPHIRSLHDGTTALDIIKSLFDTSSDAVNHNKHHLCLELLQSAAFIAPKDNSSEDAADASNLSTTAHSGSVDGPFTSDFTKNATTTASSSVESYLASVYSDFRLPPCLTFGSLDNNTVNENTLNTSF